MKNIFTFIICGVAAICTIYAQELHPYPQDTIDGHIYYQYTVEKGVGLYKIGQKFKVSQEEILELNPNIQTKGLKFGEQILIPVKSAILIETNRPTLDTITTVQQASIITQPQADTLRVQALDTTTQDSTRLLLPLTSVSTDTINDKNPFRLALILPLHANATKRNPNTERFYDFYAGVLMAIYDTQATGQPIELFIYDIDKTVPAMSKLLNDSSFSKIDAIIGPAYAQQIDTVAKLALRDSIFVLVPFVSELENINSNPFILKFNPSNEVEARTLAKYLSKKKNEINCVLVEQTEGETIPRSIQILHNALKSHQIPTTKTTVDQIIMNSLANAFVPDKENILIFNTKNYDNLQPIMPYLESTYNEKPFTLYTHYSWQDEKIPFSQIYTSIFKQSYHIPDTYSQHFEQYFNYNITQQLPRYDLLGYDLTRHLLIILDKKVNGHEIPIEHLFHSGIQSNIRYQQISQGGYENQTIHIRHK